MLYHELALIVLASWWWPRRPGRANRVGLWTFMVLWVMRHSAKLNIFLGVRNLGENFLPPHLAYLQDLLPACADERAVPVLGDAGHRRGDPGLDAPVLGRARPVRDRRHRAGGHDAGAGRLEHWLLVLPLPTEALWRWGMRSHVASATAPAVAPVKVPAASPASPRILG